MSINFKFLMLSVVGIFMIGCAYGIFDTFERDARGGVVYYEIAEFNWVTQKSKEMAMKEARDFCGKSRVEVNAEMEKVEISYTDHASPWGHARYKIPIAIATIYMAFSCIDGEN